MAGKYSNAVLGGPAIAQRLPQKYGAAVLGQRAQAAPPAAPQQDIPWAEVPGRAMEAFPGSAAQFGRDIMTPIMEPVETVKSLGNLALGMAQKLVPGEQAEEKYANAVGQFLADRYGGLEEVKRTMATDPVGFAADVSAVFTGGGALAARAPGMAGRVGQVAGAVGRAVDPLAATARGIGAVGRGVVAPTAATAFGVATGAGPMAITEAAKAGAKGGRAGRAFREQMRGIAPIEDVVTDTKTALERMRQERATTYRAGMKGVKKDTTIIDFKPIDKALAKVSEVGVFKGQTIKPVAVGAMDEIRAVIEDWKRLDPAEYHTPEGLDALKQKIGAVGEGYDPVTQKQARIIADQAYNAVKNEIIQQAPEYAKVMKGYEQASELIRDIEKTLSANPKANVDATVRKLQSVMRNNASTNYGRRVDLAKELAERGAPELMPRLAGQALSSLPPRGIQGALLAPTALATAATQPWLLPALAGTSPRVAGEAAHAAGRAAGPAMRGGRLAADLMGRVGATPRGLGAAGFQAGRLQNELRRNR